jgi:hypothetical protein
LFLGERVDAVDGIFETLVGKPAISSSVDRNLGVSGANGPWKVGTLQITQAPGRLDFLYGPVISNSTELKHLEGPADVHFRELAGAVGSFLANKNYKVHRLAIAGQCLSAAATVEEAYEVFSAYVRTVKVDYPRIREVTFRANFQKQFRCAPDIVANRMSSWSVITVRINFFDAVGRQTIVPTDSHYCTSELDLSSDVERNVTIPKDVLLSMLSELAVEVEGVLSGGVE